METKTVAFHGYDIISWQDERTGKVYASLSAMCRPLGLQTGKQVARLKRNPLFVNEVEQGIQLDTLSRNKHARTEQDMNGLNMAMVEAWLCTVNVNLIKPEYKDTLLMFQKECAKVLHDAWNPHEQTALTIAPFTDNQLAVIAQSSAVVMRGYVPAMIDEKTAPILDEIEATKTYVGSVDTELQRVATNVDEKHRRTDRELTRLDSHVSRLWTALEKVGRGSSFEVPYEEDNTSSETEKQEASAFIFLYEYCLNNGMSAQEAYAYAKKKKPALEKLMPKKKIKRRVLPPGLTYPESIYDRSDLKNAMVFLDTNGKLGEPVAPPKHYEAVNGEATP